MANCHTIDKDLEILGISHVTLITLLLELLVTPLTPSSQQAPQAPASSFVTITNKDSLLLLLSLRVERIPLDFHE